MDTNKKQDMLIDKYMPMSGEGETVASQAVTAVNKLIYKWWNDGDVFDNTHGLSGWMNDLSSYANWLYAHTTDKAKYILKSVYACDSDDDYDYLLKLLAEELLNEELLNEYEKMAKVGTIYECDGMFRYEEPSDDDDDWI